MELKTYRVTLQKTVVTTYTRIEHVQAETEADARVLAKYRDIYGWGHGDMQPETIDVTTVEEVDHGTAGLS